MAPDEQRLKYLLRLFAHGDATKEEINEMVVLLRYDDNGSAAVDWETLWNTIHYSTIGTTAPVKKMNWWSVAAAAIIVLIGTGAYFWNYTQKQKSNVVVASTAMLGVADVQPGGDRAILTLANGQQIILDSATNGILAKQGTSDVVKLANGQLQYKGSGVTENEIMYNTLGTPRGGQYRLMLPDGSKVWLNAVSSIRYPTAFTGKERVVEITGEAYFEVAKDATHPFKILVHKEEPLSPGDEAGVGDMEISVLGTHFNVNAYNDEPNIKTTLVEGSVKVTRDKQNVVIKPGEQTELNKSGTLKIIHDADIDEAVAWRNGLFEFQDADLQSILRQVMRWYDVEVDYQGNIPERFFTAIISRDKTLTGVLEILKLSDIDYKLDGKKLVITQ